MPQRHPHWMPRVVLRYWVSGSYPASQSSILYPRMHAIAWRGSPEKPIYPRVEERQGLRDIYLQLKRSQRISGVSCQTLTEALLLPHWQRALLDGCHTQRIYLSVQDTSLFLSYVQA